MRRIFKIFCFVSVLLLGVFMAGCESQEDGFYEISDETDEEGASEEDEKKISENSELDKIYVHVCGAVKKPGVYELEAGSRICHALELAGGLTESAVENSMNQAEILSDGQQIYVMSVTEENAAGEKSGLTQDGKVNINQASKEELMTLPGIGEAKANLIIQYRETMGKFSSIEDIMEIEGIKEGVFHKIKDRITVS